MIILSIPYINNKFVIDRTKKYPEMWKEFRLDYSKDFSKFPEELIDRKTIITLRDTSEGGNYKDEINHDEKLGFYQKLVEKYNCIVDCEIALFNSQQLSQINANNLIISYHNFLEKFDINKMKKMIRRANGIKARYLKFAVNLSNYSALSQIPNLVKLSNKPVIFVGMGKLGKLSRILYKHLGSAGTFIGLNEQPTASGQLTISETEKFNLSMISSSTKIGGIIGGKQVENSLGITFYNQYFTKNNIDAMYLPFVVKDIEDFFSWQKIQNCYGFSVTMPFKTKFSDKPINLFLPFPDKFFNTDAIAFEKAIEYLEIENNESVLIYGSGGTAETALSVFGNSTFILGRNPEKCEMLIQKYDCSVAIPNQNFDVIVNCTLIGMNGEDFLKETKLSLAKKVIDLPYFSKITPLIEKCKKENVPFVDGEMFWRWQAEKQLSLFLQEINN